MSMTDFVVDVTLTAENALQFTFNTPNRIVTMAAGSGVIVSDKTSFIQVRNSIFQTADIEVGELQTVNGVAFTGTHADLLSQVEAMAESVNGKLTDNGFDAYNTAFFLGQNSDDTALTGGAPAVDMVLTTAGQSISSSEYLPQGLNALYDRANNKIDFSLANVSNSDFFTIDLLYDFNQDVDDSVLTIIVEFTESTGSTFTKTINVNFLEAGAQENIEQVSRVSFFIGNTLATGSARILLSCNEDAIFKLKTLTIYAHS